MPKGQNVEERIVEMRIDNQKFESGAKQTITTLEKLEKAMHLKGDSSALNELSQQVSKFDASPMTSGIEKVHASFSALEVAGLRVISNLTDSVYNFTAKTIKGLTTDQITAGYDKYDEKTASVQTIMNSTGKSIEEVNEYLNQLMWFSDETSFSFTEMTSALANMTSTGADISKVIPMIMGMGNAVAYAGKSGAEFVRTIRNLNQSYSGGYLTLMDWRSMQLAGTNSKALTETIIKTAEAMGKIKEGEVTLSNFTDTLKDKWADKEVMERAFGYFAEMSVKAKELIDSGQFDNASDAYEYLADQFDDIQSKAALAAQQAKTFKEVIDATKDAVSTGWMTTFEYLFGNYDVATEFWTEVVDRFWEIFAKPGKGRNDVLAVAFGTDGSKGAKNIEKTVTGWGKLQNKVTASGHSMEQFEAAFRKVTSASSNASINTMIDNYGSVEKAFREGAVSADLFKQVLQELGLMAKDTSEEVIGDAEVATQSLDELRQVALEVLRGDHGNGQERIDWLEAHGYDPELIEAMTGNLKNFHEQFGSYEMTDEALLEAMEMYYQAQGLSERLEKDSFVDYLGSSASNKAIDTMEETIDLLEDADDILEEIKTDVDEVFETESDLSGGEALRGALLNILDSVVSVKDAIGSAFEDVFGDAETRGKRLRRLLNVFYTFTEKMQFSEGALKGIKVIASDIMRVFKIFGTIGGGAFKTITVAVMTVKGILDDLLTLIGEGEFSIGKALELINDRIKSVIPTTEDLQNAFDNVVQKIKGFIPTEEQLLKAFDDIKATARGGYTAVKNWAEALTFDDIKSFLPSIEKLENIYHRITGYIRRNYPTIALWLHDLKETSIIGTAFEGMAKFFSGARDWFGNLHIDTARFMETLGQLGEMVSKVFGTIFGDPEELKQKVSDFFITVWNGLKESFKSITFSDIFKAFKMAGITAFLMEVADFVSSFKRIEKEIEGVPQALSKMFSSMGDAFTGLNKVFKANAFLQIAIGVGVLAAAMWGLSKIPQEDLVHVASVLVLLGLAISKLTTNLAGDKVVYSGNKSFSLFPKLASTLIAFAVLAVGIASAVSKLSNIPASSLAKAAGTIAGLSILIAGIIFGFSFLDREKGLGNSSGALLKAAGTMIVMVVAIRMMAKPLERLAAIPFTSLAKATLVVSALSLLMAGIVFGFSFLDRENGLGNSSGAIVKAAASMIIMVAALRMMIKPIQQIAEIQQSEKSLQKALMTIATILAGLTIFTMVLSKLNGGNALKAAAAMAVLAFAMNLLIPAVAIFTGLMVAAATLIPWENLEKRIEAFHKALLPMGEFVIILMGLGVALAFAGVGVLAFGTGLLAAAGSVFLFAAALFVFSKTLDGLSEGLPKFIKSLEEIGREFKGHWKAIVAGTVIFVAFAVAVGLVASALTKLFTKGKFGTKAANFGKSIVTGIGGAVSGIGNKFIEMLPGILNALKAALVIIALYVVGVIPEFTEIFVQAFISLFDSIATSFENNKDAIVDSVTRMVKAVIDVLSGVLSSLFSKDFMENLSGTGKVLFGLATIKIGADLLNIATPFVKLKDAVGGGKEGLPSLLRNSKAAIDLLIESAGGLVPVLGIVAAITAAAVYAGKNLKEQQTILEERAFDGQEKSLEGYNSAIADTEKRMAELKEAMDNGATEYTLVQEYDALLVLLKTLKDERAEYEKQAEAVKETTAAVSESSNVLGTASEQSEKFSSRSRQLTSDLKETATAVEESASVMDRVKSALSDSGFDMDTKITDIGKDKLGEILNSAGVNIDLSTIGFSGLEDLQTMFSDVGLDVGPYLTSGLGDSLLSSEALSSLFSSESELKDHTVSDFLSLFGIASPSRVMADEVGVWIPAGIGAGIDENKATVFDSISNMLTSMLAQFSNVSNRFHNSGVQIVQGLINGISANMLAAYNTGVNLAASVENGFKQRLKIQSPSKVFNELGGYITEGVSEGVSNGQDGAIDSIVILGDALVQAISKSMAEVGYIASEDFDISPTITPVVDMSNVTAASGSMGSLLGGSYRSYVDSVNNRAANISNATQSAAMESRVNNEATLGEMRAMGDRIDALGQAITNMQIVLDSGALVGATSARMDNQLGRISARRARAN